MTAQELFQALQTMFSTGNVEADTVVHVCFQDVSYVEITEAVSRGDGGQDGRLVLLLTDPESEVQQALDHAPALLEVLESMLAEHDAVSTGANPIELTWDTARAAVAQARGETVR